jgi:hypothetical protein
MLVFLDTFGGKTLSTFWPDNAKYFFRFRLADAGADFA